MEVEPAPLAAIPASPRSVPTPPSAQISTSDTPSCAKAKLDELFVRYLVSPESKTFITALFEDVRSGKVSSRHPERVHGQLPGSPVSRLIHSHSPFGEMSPRSPAVNPVAAAGPALPADVDLGRTADIRALPDDPHTQRSILSPQPLTASAFHSPARASTADRNDVADRQGELALDPLRNKQRLTGAKETVSPTSVDVNMSSDSHQDVQSTSCVQSKQEDTVMEDAKLPNGVLDDGQSRVQVAKNEAEPSAPGVNLAVEDALATEKALAPENKEPSASAQQQSAAAAATATSIAESRATEQPRSVARPPLAAPKPPAPLDTRMAEASGSTAASGKVIPRFYFPCGRDASEREKKERHSIVQFFNAQRKQKNIDGVTKQDIAELVVEVVGVPSYFASLIFTRIAKWYPYNNSQSADFVPATPEPMSADSSLRSGDATMRDTNATANGDSNESGGATKTENGVAQNGAPRPASVDAIREEQFRGFYERECAGRPKDERLFRVLMESGSDRDYLIPADFKPLLRALLVCHQGLAFLHATPEFQHRYSETVIERIYFGCTRRHNGRLTLSDIKRSRLLETLMVVDEEEDINRERKYFSYEHFYVLYCRFWELDTNHDLQIDREDLMRYGGHSLTYRIVDRIFGGHARPLDGSENPGYMSYTDFIWFCLSEEDKTSETAIDYWFRCVDQDGDGLITMFDMEFFYQEQLHRMECFGHEPVAIRDILCQLLDMIKPNAKPPVIRRRDLKKCKLSGNFFNILFNLNKFFQLEARDPLQIRQEHATPELTDWDRFAAIEYLRLSAEEEGEEDEGWEDVAENSSPLISGEAPF